MPFQFVRFWTKKDPKKWVEHFRAFSQRMKQIKFYQTKYDSLLEDRDRAPDIYIYGGFQKWWYPKSSILEGFSITYHSFWGTPIFGNTHIYTVYTVYTYIQRTSTWVWPRRWRPSTNCKTLRSGLASGRPWTVDLAWSTYDRPVELKKWRSCEQLCQGLQGGTLRHSPVLCWRSKLCTLAWWKHQDVAASVCLVWKYLDVAYRSAPCLGRVSQCQPVWKWMWIHDILWN